MVGIGSPRIRVHKEFTKIVKENIGVIGKTSAEVTKEIARSFKGMRK